MRNIWSVSYEATGTELMAFLLECIEIKRLWPVYNRSLKRFEPSYGLYVYEDRNGYFRLILEKKKRQMVPVYTFSRLEDGRQLLLRLVREGELCPKLCYIQTGEGPCEGLRLHTCRGACQQEEIPDSYNRRVEEAIASLQQNLPSFALLDNGRHGEERSCVLIERGRFYGMGYLPADNPICDASALKDHLTRYPENDYMRSLVYQYAEKWPAKKSYLSI